MIAAPAFPTNLVSRADSDFESGVGSWAAVTDASAVTTSTAWAFTGTHSLQWTATSSAASTMVATQAYTATALLPYAASAVISPGTARTVQLVLRWFNGATHVSDQGGLVVTANGPTPISVTGSCPVGCNGVEVAAQVNSPGAGEVEQLDLVFLTQTDTQILVDWVNSPFAPSSTAGQAFSDITGLVRLDQGISCGRGRQDAVSEVQPGAASFTVHNTEGWFTGHSTASPWWPNVKLGRRCQINMADELGVWHTRFDGPVSEIDHTITVNGEAVAPIQCADVLAYLGRQDNLGCWTVETVLGDGPALHWSLDDPDGSSSAAETSGNNGPALRPRFYSLGTNVPTLAFAAGQGGVETQADAPSNSALGLFSTPLPSPFWTTTVSANAPSVNLGAQLPAYLNCGSGPGWSVEAWAVLDPTAFGSGGVLSGSASPQFWGSVFSLGDTRTGHSLMVSVEGQTGGAALWNVLTLQTPFSQGGSGRGSFFQATSSNFTMPTSGIPLHVVLTCNGNGTGTLYVNGVATVSLIGSTFAAGYRYNWIDVGGAFQGLNGWQGNISCVSQYNFPLSSGQVTAHRNMGLHGMYLAANPVVAEQIGVFANIPSFWSNLASASGITTTEYVDLSQADALETLQQFEAAELEGLIYVNAAGQLCFDGRQVRMGAGAPSVTLPAGSYDPDMQQKVTDQYLVTTAAIDTPAVAKAAVAVNVAARNDYGPYADGTADSPTEIPILAYSPIFATGQATSGSAPQLDQAQDNAYWLVNRRSDPRFKAASITLDLLTLGNPASSEYVAVSTAYGLEVNSSFALAGGVTAMPSDFGALDYFVEGVTEYKDHKTHTIGFYTSPMNASRCWKPGDAVYGVLDQTATIGVSATDDGHAIAPLSKKASADPGYPFWTPTYASTMNNGGLTGKGFVGAKDQRGVYGSLQIMSQPPTLVVGQTANAQSIPTGVANLVALDWDTIFIDSTLGWGLMPGWPNWFVVTVAGNYELDATCVWAATAAAQSDRFAEFSVNPKGTTSNTPVGSACLNVAGTMRRANSAQQPGVQVSTRMYLGVGTTVGLRIWQGSGSTLSTSTAFGGSIMSIGFVGFSTTAG